MRDTKVWLVTGANSGFGRASTVAAAAVGDTVIATARRPAALDDLVNDYPGRIDVLSSVGGQLSFAGFSAYSATKFALEGLSEALADEVRPYGIRVLIVEPGAFRTGLFGAGAYFSAETEVYAETVGRTRQVVSDGDGLRPGDPAKAAAAILQALESEDPPLRLALSGDAFDAITGHLDAVRDDLVGWEKVSRRTDFDQVTDETEGTRT